MRSGVKYVHPHRNLWYYARMRKNTPWSYVPSSKTVARHAKKHWKTYFFAFLGVCFLIGAAILATVSMIEIPDFSSFENRKQVNTTKIYDRTGLPLYDLNPNVNRSNIPYEELGPAIKNTTIAVEDAEFYQHKGVRIRSIIRAVIANLHGESQGGSTITQQLVKKSLLTDDKTVTRKLKEWILAIKMEQVLTKEQILTAYLNEIPYGGNIYGISEAASSFFGKKTADLSISEAAYLAALPNAPTYYSPYGKHRDALEDRHSFILSREKVLGFISAEEYDSAVNETIAFLPQKDRGIKAPHFVFYVEEYLEQKYGKDMAEGGGLKVTTTLDYGLQQKAEALALQYATSNEEKFNGKNVGVIALDPNTGQILTMVGSRDYFDDKIDGAFNITTASRQPGSSFKPFVYAKAFEMGYTPETVVFDVPTEFNTGCTLAGTGGNCYNPGNFDDKFRGPMTLRSALAQSINIPAVKMLYLVGVKNAISKAEDMGITTLKGADTYGLTLVLGGGEVKLLDMASAYGAFATAGTLHQNTAILKVEDKDGNVLEEFKEEENPGRQVVERNAALEISDILTDNVARTPTFGPTSPLLFPGRTVAVKTGTTNNYRDTWCIGYSPNIVVGAWAGNNDNTPMEHKSSGLIIAPLWSEVMKEALKTVPEASFELPDENPNYDSLKPVMRGHWEGNQSVFIDTASGQLATENTPDETKKEIVIPDVHSILQWVDKSDPLGPPPTNPQDDPQYSHWEAGVQTWWAQHRGEYNFPNTSNIPSGSDNIHTSENAPRVHIDSPDSSSSYDRNDSVHISVGVDGKYAIKKVDYFINGSLLGTSQNYPFSFDFIPNDVDTIADTNEIKAVVYDTVYNSGSDTITFRLK